MLNQSEWCLLPWGWKWVRGWQMFRVLLELEMFWAPKPGWFRRLIPRAGRRCMTRSDGGTQGLARDDT
jgi:hypothetical protein